NGESGEAGEAGEHLSACCPQGQNRRIDSTMAQKVLRGQSDIAGNLSQQGWCNVSALVHGNGCAAAVRMADIGCANRAWRTALKPSLSSKRQTSAGLRTGTEPMLKTQRYFAFRRIRLRALVRRPQGAWRSLREG